MVERITGRLGSLDFVRKKETKSRATTPNPAWTSCGGKRACYHAASEKASSESQKKGMKQAPSPFMLIV